MSKSQMMDELTRYLIGNARHMALLNHEKLETSELQYSSLYDFVTEFGQEMSRVEGYNVANIGESRQCFSNSYGLAFEKELLNEKYKYVEGFAYGSGIIPLLHAWVLSPDGEVIETTWEKNGDAYFGVIIPLWYVRRIILMRKAVGSVLDTWELEYPLLTGEHRWKDILESNYISIDRAIEARDE